jgi:CheY-like chemotaxis protein
VTSVPLSGLRMLLVEDDSMVRHLLERTASNLGVAVECVETGTLALDCLERTRYDVILTDLRMPRVSGLDLVAFARRHCPTTGLIVATGFASAADEAKIEQLGAILLRKPFGGSALAAALQAALGARRVS